MCGELSEVGGLCGELSEGCVGELPVCLIQMPLSQTGNESTDGDEMKRWGVGCRGRGGWAPRAPGPGPGSLASVDAL